MLRRKKQQYIAETKIYTKEWQIYVPRDQTVTPPNPDPELIPTPKDPPKRECTYKYGQNGKNKGNGHGLANGESKSMENGHASDSSELNGKPKEWQEPGVSSRLVPNCMLEWCRFGCVCESLANGTDRNSYETHCGTNGLPDCIFGCICHQIDKGERKKYKLGFSGGRCHKGSNYNKKEDDDCGFVPPGSQISLAHNEDGRPKRKSQPPERFRHGFDLNKVTLDKNFSAGSSFRSNGSTNSNGYYYHGSGDKRNRRNPLVTTNGIRSAGGINNGRDRNRNRSKSKSSTIKMLANGTIQKTRIIVRSNNLGNRNNRFAASSKLRPANIPVSQVKNGPIKEASNVTTKSTNKPNPSVGVLKNPCENHDHDYSNIDSIITGLALSVKCDSNETGDGVLINRSGTVLAVISWTKDGFMKPVVSKLRFKREHSRSRPQSPKKRPTNSNETNDMGQPTPPTDVPNIEVHDSDLAILYLPGEIPKPVVQIQNGPCSSKSVAQASGTPIAPYYRFFDLPSSYHEHSFVLYPELHAVFAVNALRAKISSIRGGAKTQDEIDSLGPNIIELNSINLNQQSDATKRGNVHLLVDTKNLIVLGTIPEAYRHVQSTNQKKRRRSPARAENRNHVSC